MRLFVVIALLALTSAAPAWAGETKDTLIKLLLDVSGGGYAGGLRVEHVFQPHQGGMIEVLGIKPQDRTDPATFLVGGAPVNNVASTITSSLTAINLNYVYQFEALGIQGAYVGAGPHFIFASATATATAAAPGVSVGASASGNGFGVGFGGLIGYRNVAPSGFLFGLDLEGVVVPDITTPIGPVRTFPIRAGFGVGYAF